MSMGVRIWHLMSILWKNNGHNIHHVRIQRKRKELTRIILWWFLIEINDNFGLHACIKYCSARRVKKRLLFPVHDCVVNFSCLALQAMHSPQFCHTDTGDLILTTLNYCCINLGNQRVFSIWNHHKCLSQLFPLHLNTHVMGLRPF